MPQPSANTDKNLWPYIAGIVVAATLTGALFLMLGIPRPKIILNPIVAGGYGVAFVLTCVQLKRNSGKDNNTGWPKTSSHYP
ncbi:Uncharacterised protein [Mobiluncus mulieris]|nr:Uncharacterised protein [Mobiluncus mulieris]